MTKIITHANFLIFKCWISVIIIMIFFTKTSVKETRISKDDEYVENGKNPKKISLFMTQLVNQHLSMLL